MNIYNDSDIWFIYLADIKANGVRLPSEGLIHIKAQVYGDI